jgi:hypothetical protein
MAGLKFRVDREETNDHGQVIGFTEWMGGPSLARIKNTVCEDGSLRTAYILSEPDTFFSIPARVNVGQRSVTGFVTVEDDLWKFIADKF